MTYSIVAYCPRTAQIGVAVQSHWFACGTVVPWLKAGIGAVATQAFPAISFGPQGLEMMAGGMSPQDAVSALIAADEGSAMRQVGMVDVHGRAAAHTGRTCVEFASQVVSDGVSLQANMMAKNGVPEAMADAWSSYPDQPLARRLHLVLEAAQEAGGDVRGSQSGAIKVASANPTRVESAVLPVDIRVDDSENPIKELGRLLDLHDAYDCADRGDSYLVQGDTTKALAAYGAARKKLPESAELALWYGVALANSGDMSGAFNQLSFAVRQDKRWLQFLERLPNAGIIKLDEESLKRLRALP